MLKKSLANMATSLRKIQDRARRSARATAETEEERSIKALFSERIVKGRPDLFVASTPVPSTPSSETSPMCVLQENVSGFVLVFPLIHVQFSQFTKPKASTSEESGPWAERQHDFNKRFGRNDAL